MFPATDTTPAKPVATRVLIVEDHPLVSDGIKKLLSTVPSYQIIGEVTSGLDVYSACQKSNPDVVLIDLGLPGMDGIDVIRKLKRRWPELVIVVITADSHEHRARDALAAGALGYVLKNSSRQSLLAALQTALAGRNFVDPAIDQTQITTSPGHDCRTRLTPRESHVLKLIAEGQRNRDIAETLTITVKTVETHRLNLMRKLDAHNVAELVRWASRLGIQ
jgi:two-component system secretion response regulator SsrB